MPNDSTTITGDPSASDGGGGEITIEDIVDTDHSLRERGYDPDTLYLSERAFRALSGDSLRNAAITSPAVTIGGVNYRVHVVPERLRDDTKLPDGGAVLAVAGEPSPLREIVSPDE